MQEGLDPRKEFEEYLKAKEGQDIDPQAAANARRELELGEKGGYAVYGDEPDRATRFKSNPEGSLNKIKEELKEAKIILAYTDSYINDNHHPKITREMPLGEFIDFIEEEENKFNPEIRSFIESWLEKYKDQINSGWHTFMFLDFVKGKGQEDERLLNSGPEN
jgi:hypothetical protein